MTATAQKPEKAPASAPAEQWSPAAAEQRLAALLAELAVPWEELHCGTKDVEEGNLLNLALKLALIANYTVRCNHVLTRLLARRTLLRETLEQSTDRRLAEPAAEGKRQAIDIRRAALIHETPALRRMKIDLIEGQAQIDALSGAKDSLDLLWKTCSRIISARSAEPLDRGS